MSIIVLGADGYIGWALTCRLAADVDEPIFAVDDLSKRARVAAAGAASAIPIAGFQERIELLRKTTGREDITGCVAGVEECIAELVRDVKPRTVVHLAQIPSAPYSMGSWPAARETVLNNELGNLAVLFALRDHAPHAHLVKMGSMGEYDHCGVPVGEGYVSAVLDGEPTSRPVPFPRAADDVYHITKINDTNFLAMACRVWGISATDVMQSIAYGTRTALWSRDPRLATRFDCDPVFGSVLNRFVSQAITGVPLTVHGGGAQTTGLISLYDAVGALAHWVSHPADRGEHRVINQATETRISILEIARLVQRLAAGRGLEVTIDGTLDPRHERHKRSACGPARNLRLREAGLPTVTLEQGIGYLLADLLEHRHRLGAAAEPPLVDWKCGVACAIDSGPEEAPEELLRPSAAEVDVASGAGST